MFSDEYSIPVSDEQEYNSPDNGKNPAFFRKRKPDFWLLTANKFGETRILRSGLCSTIHDALYDAGVKLLTQEQFEELLISQGRNGLRFIGNEHQELIAYASSNPEYIARRIIRMLNK